MGNGRAGYTSTLALPSAPLQAVAPNPGNSSIRIVNLVEGDELIDGEGFGSLFGGNALGPYLVLVAAEGGAELLAAFGEEVGYEASQPFGPRNGHWRVQSWMNADHRARYIRRRPEAGGGQGGDAAYGSEGLDDDAERAVLLGGGFGGEAVGDFLLDGDKLTEATGVIDEQGGDEGAGDLIGEVGDEGEGAAGEGCDDGRRKRPALIHDVAFDEGNFNTQAIAEEGCEAGIDFAADDFRAAFQQFFGEGSRAGADFED